MYHVYRSIELGGKGYDLSHLVAAVEICQEGCIIGNVVVAQKDWFFF